MINQTVGNYRIIKKLGEGGMGEVYVAEHTVIGRRVAIKMLLPELSNDAEAVSRFFNEARATAQINHPGLVDAYDFGHHTNGSAYIVMELLQGEPMLDRLQRERRFPIDLAAAIARQIASAVGAAHEKGIVHRDLKPENVFLTPDQDMPFGVRARILDFGVAKLTGLEGSTVKTQASQLLGTPLYMSPEQCHGAANVDQRSDIYALGCLTYEMVCGDPPFLGDGMGAILAAHIYKEPEPPSRRNREIPERLSNFILGALKKAPEERYQTMAEFIARLDAVVPRQTGVMAVATPIQAATTIGPGQAAPPTAAPVRGGDATVFDARPPNAMPSVMIVDTPAPQPWQPPRNSWFYDDLELAAVGRKFADHPAARPGRVVSCVHRGQWRFALTMIEEPQPRSWWWFFGLDAATIGAKLAEHRARLVDLDVVGDKLGAVMVDAAGQPGWWYRGLDAACVEAKLKEHDAEQVDLDVSIEPGGRRFAVALMPATGQPIWWCHDLEAQGLIHRLNDNKARPLTVKSYLDGTTRKFACVMVLNTSENWLWFAGLDAAAVRAKLSENNAYLVDLDAWSDGTTIRYSTVMYRRR